MPFGIARPACLSFDESVKLLSGRKPLKILAIVSLDFSALFGPIAQFFQKSGKYHFRMLVQTRNSLELAKQWKPDGCLFLAKKPSPHWLSYVVEHNIPSVVLTNPPKSSIPRNLHYVNMDNREVGAKAAVFFHCSGFSHFAFAGNTSAYSVPRREGFLETLRDRGLASVFSHVDDALFPPTPFDVHAIQNWRSFLKWLRALPKPTALFAASDFIAFEIASQCAIHSIHIPGHIALLGVDDSPFCAVSTPQISSIPTRFDRLTFRLCELLTLHLSGQPVDSVNFVACCGEVVNRESTSLLSTASPKIRRALDAANADFRSGLNVSELARKTGLNRSSLSRLLSDKIHLRPLELIHWRKSLRAAELLTTTRWPMEKVAEQAGFSSATRLGIVFKKTMGATPHAYRKAHSGS